MVGVKEMQARWRDFMRFSWQEISGLILAIIVTAFIFSFRDWGDEVFDLIIGLKNFFTLLIIVTFTFLLRLVGQKMYALTQGYKATFKVWYLGLLIPLIVAFFTLGRVPLVLIGTVTVALMVKQRLGEFRYGFSYHDNAMIAVWGIIVNLILAVGFATVLYFFPQSYALTKGLWLNIIMAVLALLPLPQLEGLSIFFGARFLYVMWIVITLLAAVLLLTKTAFGLILAIVIGTVIGVFYLLKGSEK